MRPRPGAGGTSGLAGLRERAALPELLFLYECATLEPPRLRPIADRLGLTVQAASHTFRELRDRGLVAVRDGRYRPTIEGVARLHGALDLLGADVRERIDRLHVIRSTRAVALGSDLVAGDPVALEIEDGVLGARRGRSGPSRGTVVRGGAEGTLVEVGGLSGIVPIVPAEITVRTLAESDLDDSSLRGRLRRALRVSRGVLAADGLEALHSVRRATDRPVVRFAAPAVCLEASRVGVPSTLFVLERDLPRVLGSFRDPSPPKLRVLPVSRPSGTPGGTSRPKAAGRARRGAPSTPALRPRRRRGADGRPVRPVRP